LFTDRQSEPPSPSTSQSAIILSLPNNSDTSAKQQLPVSQFTDIDSSVSANLTLKMQRLENENVQMKILLEKLDQHTSTQDKELEKLRQAQKEKEVMEEENLQLRKQLKSFALSSGPSLDEIDGLRAVNDRLEADNARLCERLVSLEEEVNDLAMEKASLVSTLQLMQDELMASEEHRHRTNSKS